jgi:hypothetical protein
MNRELSNGALKHVTQFHALERKSRHIMLIKQSIASR